MGGNQNQEGIEGLIEVSAELELLVSELYMLYTELFEEDRSFWWQMSLEEKNHAALIKSAANFQALGKLPDGIIYEKLQAMRIVAERLREHIAIYRATAPTMYDAYHFALAIEKSASEAHFQKVMSANADTRVQEILQKLAGADLDHARRIQSLVDTKAWAGPAA